MPGLVLQVNNIIGILENVINYDYTIMIIKQNAVPIPPRTCVILNWNDKVKLYNLNNYLKSVLFLSVKLNKRDRWIWSWFTKNNVIEIDQPTKTQQRTICNQIAEIILKLQNSIEGIQKQPRKETIFKKKSNNNKHIVDVCVCMCRATRCDKMNKLKQILECTY